MKTESAPDRFSVRVHRRDGKIETIGITRDKRQAIDWAARVNEPVTIRNVTDGQVVYKRKAQLSRAGMGGAA
jgi:hypothetical protein